MNIPPGRGGLAVVVVILRLGCLRDGVCMGLIGDRGVSGGDRGERASGVDKPYEFVCIEGARCGEVMEVRRFQAGGGDSGSPDNVVCNVLLRLS
jgi:hypothetical protein